MIRAVLDAKQEVVQSAISYGSGGGLVGLASLADIANTAQSIALILGCLVVAVRLVHDTVALIRYVLKKPTK